MDEFRKYLAQQILTEDKLITYRILSRALKVHVNTAKEMLYDFHKWQNDKRPDTIHATYLIYGTQKKAMETNGDVEMTDSQSETDAPYSDECHSSTLTLVREEQLQDTMQQYEEVTSIHVYSLGPHPLKDLQLLADEAQTVAKSIIEENSLSSGKIYGTIANPGVRKRERKGGVPKLAPAPAAVKAEAKPQVKQETKPIVKEEQKPTTTTAPPKDAKTPLAATAKKSAAAPSLKRQGSSGGISQMFAKAAAKPKKPAARTTSNTPSVADTPSPALSDDGEDDSDMPDVKADPAAGIARKSRQDDLRRMMEESDDEVESKAETPAEDPAEDMEEPPAEPEVKADEEPAEEIISTADGRKRGRRRIMKKVTKMDDQGYLITSQEQAWESFSEDEGPPASKVKVEKSEKPGVAAAAKGKKAGAKGQGNIMSFFSKK